MSSYNEAFNTLDDYHIATFFNGDAVQQELPRDAMLKLKAFVETLEDFDRALPAKMPDVEIIARPGWPAVIRSAADFLDAAVGWLSKCCADFPMLEWAWRGETFGGTRPSQ